MLATRIAKLLPIYVLQVVQQTYWCRNVVILLQNQNRAVLNLALAFSLKTRKMTFHAEK
jgi:hypothetical protein